MLLKIFCIKRFLKNPKIDNFPIFNEFHFKKYQTQIRYFIIFLQYLIHTMDSGTLRPVAIIDMKLQGCKVAVFTSENTLHFVGWYVNGHNS